MQDKLRERNIDLTFMEELIKENPLFDNLTVLLRKGADVNSKYYATRSNCIMDLIYLGPAYLKDDIEKAKILIEFMINNGADIHNLDCFGESIIHCCVNKENKNLVKLFLDKGVHPNYIRLNEGTPLDIAGHTYFKDNDLMTSIKEILIEYGAKTSLELRTVQIKKYLKVDFTSSIDFCFMSESGYLNIPDIPGADENEFLELLSMYQSFCNKEIINIHSEESNRIKEFNDRGLNLIKSIIPKLTPNIDINFQPIYINDSGKWGKYEMYVDCDTEFGFQRF